jgi:3-hydroxyacyl-[acyl-carrier-protein] dehydratase
LLPHRYPFLLVDRVIDMRGDEHGIGIKNLTMNEAQFAPFPENPVMPGMLVIEGIAQTACVLALRLTGQLRKIQATSSGRGSLVSVMVSQRGFRCPSYWR